MIRDHDSVRWGFAGRETPRAPRPRRTSGGPPLAGASVPEAELAVVAVVHVVEVRRHGRGNLGFTGGTLIKRHIGARGVALLCLKRSSPVRGHGSGRGLDVRVVHGPHHPIII